MDAKQIEQLGRDLQKASSTPGQSDSTFLITTLGSLKTGVKASEELLRATKIGVAVNRLKQHKDPNVARTASDLVAKWRKEVKQQGGGTVANKVAAGTGAGEKTAVNGANASGDVLMNDEKNATTKDSASMKDGFKITVPLEQRTSKTDGVDTNVTGNAIRDNCLKLMYDGLAFMSQAPPSTILPLATAIESASFSRLSPETSEPYKSKMRSLFQNLKNKSNPTLRERILAGEITPDMFVNMSSEELKSPERRAEDMQMQKENMDKAMAAKEMKSISSSLTCGKCGQKKVSYSQAQTRSADEPMTTFCECVMCGHRWKFS